MRRGCAVLAIVVLCAAGAGAQTPARTETAGTLPALSPEGIARLLATSRPDTPATLYVANRPIVTLRVSILDRSSQERVAAARDRVAALVTAGGVVTTRSFGNAVVVSAAGHDVLAIVQGDVDPLTGDSLEEIGSTAARQLQLAMNEIRESRQPWVIAWELTLAVLATAALAILLWTFTFIHRKACEQLQRTAVRSLSRSAVGTTVVRETRLQQ